MPAYTVDIEHLVTDQVFSYYHGEGMLHFNATLLARLHKQMPGEFRRITMDLEQVTYDLCMQHRGIEEDRVAALKPKSLREPGYGVLFNDNTFSIVDGHHRLVRRYRGGVRVMDFWVTNEDVWRYCLVPYTAEETEVIAEKVPGRVNAGGLIASAVTLHPKDKK